MLGSATEQQFLKRLFADHAANGFHAAAYKHVPLVEANPLAGLANNVGSTAQVCRAAIATGVRQVVDFYRQGCASQQRDGSLQASGRTGAAGPCRRGHSHLFFNGPF